MILSNEDRARCDGYCSGNWNDPDCSWHGTKFTPPSIEERIKDQTASDNGELPTRQISIGKFNPQPLRDKLIWVGVDLDGTLAYPKWTPDNPTSEIGDPIPENVNKVWELINRGYKVIVHTSRPWTDYQLIEQWLHWYNIPYKEIQCGKPLYAAYVDDRAVHASEDSWLPN